MQKILNSHSYDETFIHVVPRITENADYKVFIDGVLSSNYCFSKKSFEFGFKEITIELISGDLIIDKKMCWATYPTHDYNSIPLEQFRFCDWFHGLNCNVDTWYRAPFTLNFYHLYLQGPSYFKGINPFYDYKKHLVGDINNKIENTIKLKKELKL